MLISFSYIFNHQKLLTLSTILFLYKKIIIYLGLKRNENLQYCYEGMITNLVINKLKLFTDYLTFQELLSK